MGVRACVCPTFSGSAARGARQALGQGRRRQGRATCAGPPSSDTASKATPRAGGPPSVKWQVTSRIQNVALPTPMAPRANPCCQPRPCQTHGQRQRQRLSLAGALSASCAPFRSADANPACSIPSASSPGQALTTSTFASRRSSRPLLIDPFAAARCRGGVCPGSDADSYYDMRTP